MAILVLLNNFLHDFSAAGWLFCTVLLWMLLRNKIPEDEGGKVLRKHIGTILNLMKFSLLGIVVFGIFRALAYKQYEWSKAAGDSQITLLIVKHIILTVVFYLGIVMFLKGKKMIRKENRNE